MDIRDFLEGVGKCGISMPEKSFSLELLRDNSVVLKCGDFVKKYSDDFDQWEIINDLDQTHNIQIRFCSYCGKPMNAGFTDLGDFNEVYLCEECFESAMNFYFGAGKWRSTDEPGEYDGYYEALDDSGKWEDTGIFYTEWY